MNNVHRSVALQTAHKLRSAAAALLADSEAQADPRLADSLMYEAGELRARADSIEEQVKPPIEEPESFGSVVRALGPYGKSMLWQRSPMQGKHYWESETGAVEVWPDLTDVEVLRIGVGHPGGDLRGAAERLIGMLDDSPQTAAFLAEHYSGLDHALDLVRRHLTQTDDGAPPAGAGSPESDSTAPSSPELLAGWETEFLNQQHRREVAADVLTAMDVDQYLIDAVVNARPR